MNQSKIMVVLFSIFSVLMTGVLFRGNIPAAFVHQQSELLGQGKVSFSSELELVNPLVEREDDLPSFPADLISIEQAIRNVLQKYAGRVTRAELLFNDRGIVFEIDVEGSKGKYTIIEVDAETGQILGPSPEMDPDHYPDQPLDQETEI